MSLFPNALNEMPSVIVRGLKCQDNAELLIRKEDCIKCWNRITHWLIASQQGRVGHLKKPMPLKALQNLHLVVPYTQKKLRAQASSVALRPKPTATEMKCLRHASRTNMKQCACLRRKMQHSWKGSLYTAPPQKQNSLNHSDPFLLDDLTRMLLDLSWCKNSSRDANLHHTPTLCVQTYGHSTGSIKL